MNHLRQVSELLKNTNDKKLDLSRPVRKEVKDETVKISVKKAPVSK